MSIPKRPVEKTLQVYNKKTEYAQRKGTYSGLYELFKTVFKKQTPSPTLRLLEKPHLLNEVTLFLQPGMW